MEWLLIVIGALPVIVFLYLLVSGVSGIIMYIGNINFAKNIKPVGHSLKPQKKDGIFTFTTDRAFNALLISDAHIGGGILSGDEDRTALEAIEGLVRRHTPDLVVFGGDIVYTKRLQSGTRDNKRALHIVAGLMEKMQVYWTAIFGNHDTEHGGYSRAELADLLESGEMKHCLFSRGEHSIDGEGNYVINIENFQGVVTQSLYFLDSNTYPDPPIKGYKYDHVHPNQIDWYERQLLAINEKNAAMGENNPNSIMFVHIPMQQYITALEEGEILYGNRRERIGAGYDYGLYDKMQKYGQTKAVFCGHDHTNDFAAVYKGVQFTYGMSIDYLAYVWTKFYNPARGGTIIEINGSEFTSRRVFISKRRMKATLE